MSSVAPTRADFDKLLSKLDHGTIVALLSCGIAYQQGDEYMSLTSASAMMSFFKWILNAVLQLQVCIEHDGITRDDARRFIALFDRYLTPTFKASTVRTSTVGQEIRRTLNHMALIFCVFLIKIDFLYVIDSL
jgi:hypothetical protein